MTADEVGKLLGLMALADNRKPPQDDEGEKAMITFWLEMVGDLTYADASQAVMAHYRETREWIMPSNIRERVKAVQAERLRRNPVPPPPPELLGDEAAYRKWLRDTTLQIANDEAPVRAIEARS